MGSLESAPRICRSQADHFVTGCLGAVHPIGHPISQSEKFGLKVRSPADTYLNNAIARPPLVECRLGKDIEPCVAGECSRLLRTVL